MSKLVYRAWFIVLILNWTRHGLAAFNYGDAFQKSLLFFEQQRSGRLPKINVRNGEVNLTGGYYDAGDNIKFGFPMAYSVTMLSWGLIEFTQQYRKAGQAGYAKAAIKWGTDYLIKAHPKPYLLYGQVGDGPSDHSCWMRPEDMTTPRGAYFIDSQNPGTELAGETAAAMASSAIVFRTSDPKYSATLLRHAKDLFKFADQFRRKYTLSLPQAKEYYDTWSGYNDELLWAASWLYLATGDVKYLQYVVNNAYSLGGVTTNTIEMSWDNKYIGVQVLMAKVFFSGKRSQFNNILLQYRTKAEQYICTAMNLNSYGYYPRTNAGLLYFNKWNPIQYVTSAVMVISTYADILKRRGLSINCGWNSVSADNIQQFAKSQIDYILGNNPMGMSYMVGFGKKYPQRVHHRAASMPSIKSYPRRIGCSEGMKYLHTSSPNKNVLVGAIVGGPDKNDWFPDDRSNFKSAEVSTYMNAPFVGALARAWGGYYKNGHIFVPGL